MSISAGVIFLVPLPTMIVAPLNPAMDDAAMVLLVELRSASLAASNANAVGLSKAKAVINAITQRAPSRPTIHPPISVYVSSSLEFS